MKIFTFAAKKIDSKLKPANIDDIRWFGVLVDYCLVKVYLAESSVLVCIIVFPLTSILKLKTGSPGPAFLLILKILPSFSSNFPSSPSKVDGSLGAAL
ncbi:MAG: hypothetical protein HG446_004645 [Flavobacteriaceae bacterium]|nr:hypothetical protein [Flavobacteriaceae bacterium]